MSETSPIDRGTLPPADALRLEAVCDRFEQAWHSGRGRPPAEDFLTGWEGPVRELLLRELIQLEMFHRRGRGETPTAGEYQARFPELDPEWLSAAVASAGAAPAERLAGGTGEFPGGVGPARPAAESAGRRIGPYKLLQKIGEGGMGAVWMAEQERPVRRRVALKVIKPGLDSEQVIARFEAERQALALMDHPNIAKVFDAGTTDSGRPYFVMELVKGLPITQFCDDNRLTARERLELFVPACQAVQHAHQKGVIHRDLKPSNVLVALYDGRPVPKVIDFGVAKATHQRLTERTLFTEFGAVVGTLEYMSPEQAELNALDVDTRSDIYSLGVLLYELLTGSTPLDRKRLRGAAFAELLRLIREEEPPKPSTRLSDSGEALASISAQRRTEPGRLPKLVRGELDWVVMRALEKDRNRRYETANAFARDVQRYLADEPVEACPPSAGYRLKKLLRRYKRPALVAGAIALLLVAGLVGTSWAWAAAVRARDAEARERQRAERAEADATKDRDEAVEQKKRADEQAAIAKAVSDFLQNDLLTQASGFAQQKANFQPNPKLTVREALDRAAARIGDRFRDQPMVEALIRHTIGGTYFQLGEGRLGVPHAERSVALYRAKYGPDHRDTLSATITLASAYLSAGRPGDAMPLYEEALKRSRAVFGPDHDFTITCLVALTQALEPTGRRAEVLPLCEELLRLRTARLGPDHPQTLADSNGVARGYLLAGRPADAIAKYEELLQRQKAQSIATAWTTSSGLALAYKAVGRFDEAAQLLEGILPQRKAEDGPDHPYTLNIMRNLAGIYRDAGRAADAVALAEDELRLRKAKQGADHLNTLFSRTGLAWAYMTAGRGEEAVGLYEEALKLHRAKLPPGNPSTLAAMVELSFVYRTLGRIEQGEALMTEAMEHCRNRDNEMTDFTLNEMGAIRQAQKRYTEAEPLLRECLAIREKKAPDTWRRFATMSLLGGAVLGQEKYAEAEPLLLQGYEGLHQRAAHIPVPHKPRLLEALERLVQLYDAWGKPKDAAKWRKELQAVGPAEKNDSQ